MFSGLTFTSLIHFDFILYMVLQNVLRGGCLVIQAYLRKQGKSQINNLTLHLKELQKEKQVKPKAICIIICKYICTYLCILIR